MRVLSLPWLAGAAVALITTAAAGETLYRWVDDEGRVTYQDRPPPDSAVEVETREIDPDFNIVPASPLVEPSPAPAAQPPAAQTPPRAEAEPESGTTLSPIERAILLEQMLRELEGDPPPDGGAPTAPGSGEAPGAPAAPGGEGAPVLPGLPGGETAPGAPLTPPGTD